MTDEIELSSPEVPEIDPRVRDVFDEVMAEVGPPPPAEIIVPPQPLVATCPECGTERSLPENWQELLRETAEPDWDGILRCVNEHEPAEMGLQYRGEQFLVVTEGGPHEGKFVGGADVELSWPLPYELPGHGGGRYVKVSESALPPMPPDGHVMRGAKYKWVPADVN